jgi:hypothetical protein
MRFDTFDPHQQVKPGLMFWLYYGNRLMQINAAFSAIAILTEGPRSGIKNDFDVHKWAAPEFLKLLRKS